MVVVLCLFLAVPLVCLLRVIDAFPDHTHLHFSFPDQLKKLGPVARKPVFGVSDKASKKPVSSATETS